MGEGGLVAGDESRATLGSAWASDVVNIKNDLDENLSLTTGVDFTLSGIDILLSAANPFGGLISNGVGWLMEHIPGLSDVWDKLSGDPTAIQQITSTWANISNSLSTSASEFSTASNQIEQWSGQAADSYRQVATGYGSALGGLSNDAEGYSLVVQLIGGGVAGCKDAVYTLISEFIEYTVIPAILGAIATAWCTFGGSVAAAITYIEIQADITAGQVTVKITEVTTKIVEVSERGAKVIEKTAELAEKLEKLEKSLDHGDSFLRKEAKEVAKGTARGEVEGARTPAEKADEKNNESGEGGDGSGTSGRTPAEAGAR